jgi:hypothetical protein
MAEIVLASCNEKYYNLYGATFEKSLQNLNQPYHIHRCNEDCPWDEIKKGSKNGVDKVWYACSRYLILPEMIEEHGGVFVSDIDAVFIKPIPFPNTKIGLVKTSPKPHRSEWEQKGMHVMAGMFYCSDVDIAIRIRDKILELPKKWFVDQIAIHEVIKNETSRTYFFKPPSKFRLVKENDFAVMPRGNYEQKLEFRRSINTVIKNHS